MKSIDEAIQHCEEVAHQNEILMKRYDDASGYNRSHNEKIRTNGAKGCERLISLYRQLVKWLKELKRYKELFDGKHGRIIDESQIKSVYYHEEPVMIKGFQLKNLVLDHTDAPTILEKNQRGESSMEKDGVVTTECKMTNGDIAKLFHEKYPDMRIQDYRYLCHEMFTNNLYGITIWLENGDVIEYYPKEGKQNDCIQTTKQDISEKL